MQENIKIGEIVVPTIKDGDETWYPISYTMESVLLKTTCVAQIKKDKDAYDYHIEMMEIDYSFKDGGLQNTYCINKESLINLLKRTKLGRLSPEQKHMHNKLIKHLGVAVVINTDERFIDNLSAQHLKKHNIYVQDCIKEILNDDPNIKFQKCTKCNKYYPHHINFFKENQTSIHKLDTVCRDCNRWGEQRQRDRVRHNQSVFTSIYKDYGEEIYMHYRDHNTIEIYNHYITTNKKHTPKIINNKEDYLIIVKYLHDNGDIDIQSMTIKEIGEETKLKSFVSKVTIEELYFCLFNDHPRQYPWHYEKYILCKPTYQDMKVIFYNYLKEKNIKIENPFDFDYTNIITKCGLQSALNGKHLEFIMHYYDYKYGAYQFKGGHTNYWKDKENRIDAMKYLVENDLSVPIDKIPLYLTKYTINKQSRTLYNILTHDKYYKGNLFKWINECYPDKFIESDFNINIIRNEFDSMEEAQVHDYLYSVYGKNLIYNQREGTDAISIEGMLPDWFLITNEGCYIIEYFGLYQERHYYNKRLTDYIHRADEKICKYNKLSNYKCIFILPDDLNNDMEGLKNKIKNIGHCA